MAGLASSSVAAVLANILASSQQMYCLLQVAATTALGGATTMQYFRNTSFLQAARLCWRRICSVSYLTSGSMCAVQTLLCRLLEMYDKAPQEFKDCVECLDYYT